MGVVSCISSLQAINGVLLPNSSLFSAHQSPTIFKWGSRRDTDGRFIIHRAKGLSFRVLANPNVSTGKENSKEVIMVDPVEAKRLAAKQMEKIKAKEKFKNENAPEAAPVNFYLGPLKRKRQVEAINGAWAMIGLTAGLVMEGKTGNSILAQVTGYWTAFISFFVR